MTEPEQTKSGHSRSTYSNYWMVLAGDCLELFYKGREQHLGPLAPTGDGSSLSLEGSIRMAFQYRWPNRTEMRILPWKTDRSSAKTSSRGLRHSPCAIWLLAKKICMLNPLNSRL